jgi:TfoX/Sxy family transcriptional regulator of competence genes
MKMPKASDEDRDRFRALIEDLAHIPAIEVKPMFGQLGAFVNGNMFAGLFGSSIGVKLDEPDTAELRASGGGPFGPEERPMSGYTTIPDDADASAWAERSAAYVATLPAKPTKK